MSTRPTNHTPAEIHRKDLSFCDSSSDILLLWGCAWLRSTCSPIGVSFCSASFSDKQPIKALKSQRLRPPLKETILDYYSFFLSRFGDRIPLGLLLSSLSCAHCFVSSSSSSSPSSRVLCRLSDLAYINEVLVCLDAIPHAIMEKPLATSSLSLSCSSTYPI